MIPSFVLTTLFSLSPSASDARASSKNSANDIRVSYIDVGKGDCILIQAGESAVFIDTGYENTSNKVLSYVRAQGVSRLDCIIITHYDRDHIGGVRTIGKELPVDTIYLPGYKGSDKNYRTLMASIEDVQLPVRQVTETLSLKLGSAQLTLYPSSVTYDPHASGDEGNDNDLSLVATLTCGNDSYLFTGDLEKEGVDAYLGRRLGRFDVLKMPCHGKKNQLIDELLESVQPQIAIITDSNNDPADKKTLKALKGTDASAYRTGACGTIIVASDGTGTYSVKTDRG